MTGQNVQLPPGSKKARKKKKRAIITPGCDAFEGNLWTRAVAKEEVIARRPSNRSAAGTKKNKELEERGTKTGGGGGRIKGHPFKFRQGS